MQKQLHKLLPEQEKWARSFEMIENGRAAIVSALKQKFPFDSDTDIFIKMVNVLYKNDLSPEFLNNFEISLKQKTVTGLFD